jgi:hypothetical protein
MKKVLQRGSPKIIRCDNSDPLSQNNPQDEGSVLLGHVLMNRGPGETSQRRVLD